MRVEDYILASELMEQIYDSVSHPDGWQITAGTLASAFDADGCSIWLTDIDQPRAGIAGTTFHDIELINLYNQQDSDFDAQHQQLKKLPPNRMYTSEQIMPREEFEQTRLYQEIWKVVPIEYSMGGFLTHQSDKMAMISLWRAAEPPFSDAEVEILDFLRPHLAQALSIQDELNRSNSVLESGMLALEQLKLARVFVSLEGQVLGQNKLAEQMVADKTLVVDKTRLRLPWPSENLKLQQLILSVGSAHGAVENIGGGFKVNQGSDDMEVLVLPYQPDSEHPDSLKSPPAAVIFFKHVGRDAPIPRGDLLRNLYGLTASEVKICISLMDGVETKNIAAQQEISLNAVRYHCKNILRKTGSSRQAELVLSLSNSLVNIGADHA